MKYLPQRPPAALEPLAAPTRGNILQPLAAAAEKPRLTVSPRIR
jgi:hypothetical protein